MKKRIEYVYNDKGIFSGTKENILTDRDTKFFLLPFCTTEEPKPQKGKVAVINEDKTSWNYVEDKSGEWFHKETKELLTLTENDFDKDISEYTRAVPEFEKSDVLSYDKKTDSWKEDAEKKKAKEISEAKNKILYSLNEIDVKSIRAHRAYTINKSDEEYKKLLEYEESAKSLRNKLKELEK